MLCELTNTQSGIKISLSGSQDVVCEFNKFNSNSINTSEKKKTVYAQAFTYF